MKSKLLVPVFLLCALVLVALLVPTATASASLSERAQFHVNVNGDCLVDLVSGPSERAYVEVARAGLSCSGQGTVTGKTDLKGMSVYIVDPSTVEVAGSVRATWNVDGVSYEFRARLYGTADTDTFLGVDNDAIIVGSNVGEDWVSLSYSGTFTVGAERNAVEGPCCVVTGTYGAEGNPPVSAATIKFIIPGHGQFGLTWANEEGMVDLWGPYYYLCPAANALSYGTNMR